MKHGTKLVGRLAWALGCGWMAASAGAAEEGLTYTFREPHRRAFTVLPAETAGTQGGVARSAVAPVWLRAYPAGGDTNQVYFVSSRVSVKPAAGVAIADLVGGRPATPSAAVPGWWRVEAGTPTAALALAEALTADARVVSAAPEMRRPVRQHGTYAAAPNDPLFNLAFHLENRAADGARAGADLNVRAAWPFSRGTNVVVGVVDDGIEWTHPDLTRAAISQLHTNFADANADALPRFNDDNHGTAVAGIIAATTGNGRGVSGVAPGAELVAMRIFSDGIIPSSVTDQDMASVFRYHDDLIWVQNHSWGFAVAQQSPASGPEMDAVEQGATLGRGGKGTVYIRSSGNLRQLAGNANEDGYLTTPWVVPVAAVRSDGRVSRYSSPGANVLVAAVSDNDDGDFPRVPTTDRTGLKGYAVLGTGDTPDYGTGSAGFTGTSAAAPQISGVAALMLSANTNLALRDVQQILVLAARHLDLADPAVVTNGAGLRYSENVGYGVVDAGVAVDLARQWPPRPALSVETVAVTTNLFIPDDGLRVEAPGMPGQTNFAASAGLGYQADRPTALLPLVHVGQAALPLATNLAGKAALIERGPSSVLFIDKIRHAADAGAAFAVIYNNTGTSERLTMAETDFAPIPAVFLGRTSGQLLAAQLTQTNVSARIATVGASVVVPVARDLVCEHVLVRIQTSHPRRGSLRITLTSPSGTVAALQPVGDDPSSGPIDWTYVSTQAFFEPARGPWTVTVCDQAAGNVGNLVGVTLTVRGAATVDSDADGLDDGWEANAFGSLAQGPKDDPDGDGWNNAAEQALGTDPEVRNRPLALDVSRWNDALLRVSWPGNGIGSRAVEAAVALPDFGARTNVPSRFPVTEWFTPSTNAAEFFRVLE